MSKTLTFILNNRSNLVDATSLSETWCDFWVDFWGAKNRIKSEYKLKEIRKSPKHLLTNNFVGNLTIYSKEHRQIWNVLLPFKEPVTISALFWKEASSKLNVTLKILANMTKIT